MMRVNFYDANSLLSKAVTRKFCMYARLTPGWVHSHSTLVMIQTQIQQEFMAHCKGLGPKEPLDPVCACC